MFKDKIRRQVTFLTLNWHSGSQLLFSRTSLLGVECSGSSSPGGRGAPSTWHSSSFLCSAASVALVTLTLVVTQGWEVVGYNIAHPRVLPVSPEFSLSADSAIPSCWGLGPFSILGKIQKTLASSQPVLISPNQPQLLHCHNSS